MKTDVFPRAFVPVAALVIGSCTGLAAAQTDTSWLNPADGLWTNALNWSTGAPLDATFNAHINVAGALYVVTLDQDVGINDFEMLSADATLTLALANLAMQGGYVQQAGRVTGGAGSSVTIAGGTTLRNATLDGVPLFAAQGMLLLDGPGDTSILNTLVSHTGALGAWQGSGNLVFGGGAGATGLSLGAAGTFTIANDQSATWDNSGVRPDLSNAGLLDKSGGAGVTSILGVRLVNTGTVRASTGTLRFDTVSNVNAGVLTGGTWRVENNAALDLVGISITTNRAVVELSGAGSSFAAIDSLQTNDAAGTLRLLAGRGFTAQGSLANAGTVEVGAGAMLRVNAGSTFTSSNGTVSGEGASSMLVVDGAAELQGGTLLGLSVFSRGTLRFGGGALLDICDTCFDHSGVGASWDGTGAISMGQGAAMSFGVGSTFTLANEQTMSWDNTGARPTLTILGELVRDGAGTATTISGVELTNAGMVRVMSGTLTTDTVQNLSAGVLGGGEWEVHDNASLDFAGETITTNGAVVTLDGANAAFGALDTTSVNNAAGELSFRNGRSFTTAGDFTNDGAVRVAGETGAAMFKVAPGSILTNYDALTRTITGGSFRISAAGQSSGAVEIDGLDIATLDAAVMLDGPGAALVDATGVGDQNALRNLAMIGMAGDLDIRGGKDLDTAADLTVAATGVLGVGATSTFTVNGDLTNFDGLGTFSDGSFTIGGTLRADNARVVTLANSLTLDGDARIERPDGAGGFVDALATLDRVDSAGLLAIQNGHGLTLEPHDLTSEAGSELKLGPVAAMPGDTMLHVQGSFDHAGALTFLGGALRVDGNLTNRGSIAGNGTIDLPSGSLLVNNGTLSPGNSPGLLHITGGGDLEIGAAGFVRIEIAGLVAGVGHDQLWVDGRMVFDELLAGTLEVTVDPAFTPLVGQRFEILRFDGGAEGWFEEVIVGDLFRQIREGDRFILEVVPTPGAALVVAMGGLLAARRRRR